MSRNFRLTQRITNLAVLTALILPGAVLAQSSPVEKSFPQSKVAVEKALKSIQSGSSGSLPVLDGFTSSDHPLDQYQRAFYKCTAKVTATPAGGSSVQMTAKITAWYTDPVPAKSGYQVLPSNGRLEGDCLSRLDQALRSVPAASADASNPAPPARPKASSTPVPAISAPMPGTSTLSDAIAASKTPLKSSPPPSSATGIDAPSASTQKAVADRRIDELTTQAKNLEEILHNQAHPGNLVAVKKSGTPIYSSPTEGAKVLFLADAEDEFEMLDKNPEWVHVRISGISRGWIRRSSLELPETAATATEPEKPETKSAASDSTASVVPGAPFQVENEQVTSFPGEWAPLRGKIVKVISVQKTNPNASGAGAEAKLDFAKTLLGKEYAQISGTETATAGLVVIFDSEDGGMLAATLPTLKLWTAGTLSDEAFWRRCFLDPPEAFHPSSGQ